MRRSPWPSSCRCHDACMCVSVRIPILLYLLYCILKCSSSHSHQSLPACLPACLEDTISRDQVLNRQSIRCTAVHTASKRSVSAMLASLRRSTGPLSPILLQTMQDCRETNGTTVTVITKTNQQYSIPSYCYLVYHWMMQAQELCCARSLSTSVEIVLTLSSSAATCFCSSSTEA